MINKTLVLRRFLSFARSRDVFQYSFNFSDHSGALLEEILDRLSSQEEEREKLEDEMTRKDNDVDAKFLEENPDGKWTMEARILLLELLKDMSTWHRIWGWNLTTRMTTVQLMSNSFGTRPSQ